MWHAEVPLLQVKVQFMFKFFLPLCAILGLVVSLSHVANANPAALLHSNHPLADKIWLVQEQRFISREHLANLISKPRYVFLGETHDNPQHHQYQAWAIEQLIKQGRRPVIALEMLDDKQNTHLTNFELTNSTQFFDAVNWDKTGWPARAFYAPLMDVIIQNKLTLVPANMDRQALRELIAKQNDATLADLATYMKGRTVMAGEEDGMRQEIIDSHCGLLPDGQVPKLMYGQQLRDAIMAQALVKHINKDGAVLVAGSAHTRKDRGAPAYVLGRQADATQFTLIWLEVEKGFDEPADYAEQWRNPTLPFDAVWFTPAVDRPDPCAEMKAHFKNHVEQKKSAPGNDVNATQ